MELATVPLTLPRSALGPVTVEAQPVAPGLYIHPTSGADNFRPSDQWRLAHHSGLSIGAFPCEELAREAGEDVADLADWTCAAEQLTVPGVVDLDELGARILWAGGVLLRRKEES